ncbi:hypothetical protein G4B88_024296 [Cannabis sativa]|uniref:XPG N-terminal domain-containing protein n=1 Tax=Cannabis sativa TaxID=3483 RepID=A0A7J6GG59_CANSA|nr:hypothetical protein G4B88_024296 [Cannabis sativa]
MKPYIEPIHIKKYAGKRVGIDAYSWLHKGAYSCSMELRRISNREIAMAKLKEGNVSAATEFFQMTGHLATLQFLEGKTFALGVIA